MRARSGRVHVKERASTYYILTVDHTNDAPSLSLSRAFPGPGTDMVALRFRRESLSHTRSRVHCCPNGAYCVSSYLRLKQIKRYQAFHDGDKEHRGTPWYSRDSLRWTSSLGNLLLTLLFFLSRSFSSLYYSHPVESREYMLCGE